MKSRHSLISLISGIFAVLVFTWARSRIIFAIFSVILALTAIVFGHISLKKIHSSDPKLSGRGKSFAGLVFGYLTTFLFVVLIIFPTIKYALFVINNPPNYEIELALQESPTVQVTQDILKKTIDILSARLRYHGIYHNIQSDNSNNIGIKMSVLDTTQLDHIFDILSPKVLSFHLVHDQNELLMERMYLQSFQPPPGYKYVPHKNEIQHSNQDTMPSENLRLSKSSNPEKDTAQEVDLESLFKEKNKKIHKGCWVEIDPALVDDIKAVQIKRESKTREYSINITFGPEGADKFGRVTQNNIGKQLAFVIDEKLITAPKIREPILNGMVTISGTGFTHEEIKELATFIKYESLPLPVVIKDKRYLY